MTHRQIALAQRIRLELDELEQTIAAIDRHWKRAKASEVDQDAVLNTELLAFADFLERLENHE